MPKYRLGNVTFGTKEAKQIWILNGAIHSLDYIGKESELSPTENDLRKLAIKDIKKVIKDLEKPKVRI